MTFRYILQEAQKAAESRATYFWYRGCGWKKNVIKADWSDADRQIFARLDQKFNELFGPDYLEFVLLKRKAANKKTPQVGVRGYEQFY